VRLSESGNQKILRLSVAVGSKVAIERQIKTDSKKMAIKEIARVQRRVESPIIPKSKSLIKEKRGPHLNMLRKSVKIERSDMTPYQLCSY